MRCLPDRMLECILKTFVQLIMHFLVGLLRLFRNFGMLIGIPGKKWAVLTGSAKANLSAAHAAYSAKRSLPSHRNDVPPSIDLNGSHLSRHHHLGAALLRFVRDPGVGTEINPFCPPDVRGQPLIKGLSGVVRA